MSGAGGVERLPWASLRGYAALSSAALAAAGYHALRLSQPAQAAPTADTATATPLAVAEQLKAAAPYMLREPLCLWAVVNCVCCVSVVLGATAARRALGAVRGGEAAAARDALSNFAFHKLMLVVGVVGVQYADELLIAAAWFTVLAALTALATLANARLTHLGPGDGGGEARGAEWLGGGVAACGALLLAATWPLAPQPAHSYSHSLMAAECLVVCLWGVHAAARRALSRYDTKCIGFDTLAMAAEALHVVHMWCRSGLLLSLPALVLLLRLRRLLHDLSSTLRAACLQRATLHHITHHYPMASAEEVKQNQDKCAICWEPMEQARRLPCHHLFHNACLCRWVSQDASCPTCRRELRALRPPPPPAAAAPASPPLTANHLFHFDGSRYVSWLPSFSVEVTRTRTHVPAVALDAMALQVQQLFPHFTRGALLADLAVTRSPHLTIDNILTGRLSPPPAPTADPTDTAMGAPPAPLPGAAAAAVTSSSHAAAAAQSAHHVMVGTHTHEDDEDTQSPVPVEFSAEAREREALLARRKGALLAAARRRYLQRHPRSQS